MQLVYNELNPLAITNKPDTAILEEFTITQDNLAEMRRNFAFQSTIIFGMLQFRVTEFVRLINNIVSMNDIFSTLQLDDRGFKVKSEAQAKDAKPDKKSSKKDNTPKVVIVDVDEDEEDEGTTDKPKAT